MKKMKLKTMTALLLAVTMAIPGSGMNVIAEEQPVTETEETLAETIDAFDAEDEEETQAVVEEIWFAEEILNMNSSEEKEVALLVLPEDADLSEVVWSCDDTDLLQVTGNGGHATFKASDTGEGIATVTATLGELEAECTVFVRETAGMMAGLKFTASAGGTTSIFELEETDHAAKQYNLYIPAKGSVVYAWPTLRTGFEEAVITASYTDRYGDAVTKTLSQEKGISLSFLLEAGSVTPVQVDITVTMNDRTETHHVTVIRTTAMKAAAFTLDNGADLLPVPAFSTDIYEYDIEIPENIGQVQVKMEAVDEKSTVFYVNGEAGEAERTITNSKDLKDIVLSCGDGDTSKPITYTFHVISPAMHTVEFFLARGDIAIHVYDAAGILVKPEEDGTYLLQEGKDYTCSASAAGYVSKVWSIHVTEDMREEVKLDKINTPAELPDMESEWSGNYKQEGNQNVVDAVLPGSANETKLDWMTPSEEISNVILVDDLVCYYTAQQLILADRNTGAVVHQAALSANGMVTLNNKPVYGGGLLFVPLVNGQIQAFDAFTLNPIWIYANEAGGIVSGLTYDSGILYAGFYKKNEKNVLAAIDIQDEKPQERYEKKAALWTHMEDNGYYQANAVTSGQIVYAVSEGGILTCIDKVSGQVLQTVKLGAFGGTHAGVAISNGRLYFSTKEGYLVSYALAEKGVDQGSVKSLKIGGYSESTPTIVGDRIYVGASSMEATTVNPEGTGYFYLCVVSLAQDGTMTLRYQKQITGQVSASVVVTPGDAANMLYFTISGIRNGGFYCMSDPLSEGEGSPSYILINKGSMDRVSGEIVAGSDGRFYLHFASGKLAALSTVTLAVTTVTCDCDSKIDGGLFQPSKDEHDILVPAGTEKVKLSLETIGAEHVLMNGEETNELEVTMAGGSAEVEAVLMAGDARRTIRFHISERKTETGFGTLMISNSAKITDPDAIFYYPAEDIDDETEEIHFRYNKKSYNRLYLYANVQEGSNATMTVRQGSTYATASTINATTYVDHSVYYPISFSSSQKNAVVWITITAEDGDYSRIYKVYVDYDNANPVIDYEDDACLSGRTKDTVDVTFTSSDKGRLYYLIYDEAPNSFPTPAMYLNEGRTAKQRVTEGENTITLDGLSKESQVVYALVYDYGCNWSLYSAPIRISTGDAPLIPMTGISLSEKEMTMGVGKIGSLSVDLLPLGNTDEPEIVWISSDMNIVSASGRGRSAVLKAVGGGDCEIIVTVTQGEEVYQEACQVHVPKEVIGINLSTYHAKLNVGEQLDVFATVLPEDLEEEPTVVWRNSNQNVVTLERKGNQVTLTAQAEGTSTIEVLCGKASIVCKVTVTDPEPKPEILYGDVNHDGKVNAIDASLVRQYSVRLVKDEEIDLDAGDVNGDGWVNALDSALIRQYSAELINCFPVEETK